jgi:molybdopterin molybdotransferase
MGAAAFILPERFMAEPRPPSSPVHDVRMRGFRDRTDVDVVLALLAERVQPLPAEPVSLAGAAGRVLAAHVVAEVCVPLFDRSAMDGYALRGEETFGAGPYNPLEFRLIGEARPGKGFAGKVEPGQAVRIMTGAPLPAGADAVLMAESADEQADILRVTEAVPPGRHIGRRGEDIAAGSVLLRKERRLRPQDVAVLASIGLSQVPVVRRPTVELIITGDELLPAGSKPEGCRIVDSNSVMLEALVRRDGGLPHTGPIVPDGKEAVRDALQSARADVILVSGGSSVGKEDHAPMVLAEEGELAVHGVAMRPSSPAGVGFLGDRPVFLLPGNPVSCLAAYDFFAGPAVRRLSGRGMGWPYRWVERPLAYKIASAVGRVDYVRVQIREGKVEPIATSGASILSSTTRADGFVIVPRDSEGHGVGEQVRVYLYDES